MLLICSLVGLLDVSQAGLKPASGALGILLFSVFNVVQRSFIQLGVQDVKAPFLLGSFFLPNVAPVSQQGHSKDRAQGCLLLCPSHHLGSSPVHFKIELYGQPSIHEELSD
jgi:hypothetical protein